jgi:APA family basic amino acid/polyamine antiporter
MIPIAGSAYTYSYATMGEFVAWIIGWDLVLEYALGAATVAIAWSEYFNKILEFIGIEIPYQFYHSPLEVSPDGVHGIINIPAIIILGALSALLIRGIKESATVNNIIVITKVSIVILVIVIGWGYINPVNHTPFIPAPTTYTTAQGITHPYGGIMGILGAAGVVFFAFIGFDAVSTAAQEAKNPKRDMPIGILGSLVVCTLLYVAFSYVLSGVATVQDFRTAGKEASVTYAILTYMHGYEWLAKFVTVAILFGFSSVILVMLLGQSRVFYSMAHDGLVPAVFAEVHPTYKTPWKSNMIFFVFTSLFAGFLPESVVGEMTSIGTLFAFILVCAGVWIMRVRRPDVPRGFVVPALPVVAVLGIIVCGSMIYGLGWTNWVRLGIWLLIGLVFYFGYGRSHSRLAQADAR